jgi:biopolymer transport protein ExbD
VSTLLMKLLTRLSILVLLAFLPPATRLHASMAQQEIPPDALVINVDENGAIRLEQDPVEFSDLADRIRQTSTTRKVDVAVIVTAPAVAFRDVVRLFEVTKAAGIERVGIVQSGSSASRQRLVPPNATLLSVDRTGVLRLNGERITLRTVSSRLQQIFRRRGDRTVFVQAYGSLAFDSVTSVIDAAKAAGAMPIGLVSSSE